MRTPVGKCKMCDAEFEQTASNDRFCSRYCMANHKNKLCNERWLKAKPLKRIANASALFAASGTCPGFTSRDARHFFAGGL